MVVQQQAAATGAVSALARRAVLVIVALTIATATGVATPLVLNMITGYAEGVHLLFHFLQPKHILQPLANPLMKNHNVFLS